MFFILFTKAIVDEGRRSGKNQELKFQIAIRIKPDGATI
jgi:hypothetical protein